MGTRARLIFLAAVAASSVLVAAPRARAALPVSEELVREARAHEAAHEEDLAVRRYTEALRIDGTNAEAYLGLGALRMRLGDAREAERVYSVALDHVPSLRRALEGRARARWAVGRHEEAEADMDAYATFDSDAAALRDLATWYGRDGRAPAELAAWRRILTIAAQSGDAALAREARLNIVALQIVVGPLDPASTPPESSAVRRGMAAIARRGG